MTAIIYSPRLGAITPEQFQAALDRFGLGQFLSAEPTVRGLFGQNVFISTSEGDFVMRGSPHHDTQLACERFFAQQVHQRTTVPSPWPYLVDEGTDIFGWSYGIMRRMPGMHLDETNRTTLSSQDRRAIATAMGETLAALGAATFPACGHYDPVSQTISAVPGGIAAVRQRWIDGMMADAMRFCPATITPDAAWISEVTARGIAAECHPCTPSVTTSDFGEGNAVVERFDNGWRCSGVFDFMEYSVGDLEHAMVRPALNYAGEDPVLGRAFITAYAQARGVRPLLAERMAFSTLGDRLCIWNYGHSLATWFPPELRFREWAEPVMTLIGGLIEGIEASLP